LLELLLTTLVYRLDTSGLDYRGKMVSFPRKLLENGIFLQKLRKVPRMSQDVPGCRVLIKGAL
jgi:hypothetical protein